MKLLLTTLFSILTLSSIAQKPITSIPFELFGDHIIMQVSIDESEPLDFVFDTGSGYTVLDMEVAKKLGLGGKTIDMNQASSEWQLIKHNTLEINDFLMEKNIKVYATELNHLEISLGRELDGILGYDLLKHHSIQINFDEKLMKIYDHSDSPKNGDGVSFDLNTSIPTIDGAVVLNNGEKLNANFYIMTGAGTTLDFNSPFATKNNVIDKTGQHYSYYVKGLGDDENLHYEGHIESLTFGNQEITDLPIGISTSKEGIQASNEVSCIIGSQILRMYNMTIDYGTKMIYFEKDHTYDANFKVNCSGIDVQLSKDKSKVLIHRVFENSPASTAGIKVDSELLSINGKTMKEVNLAQVKKMLKKEGEKVELVVMQGSSKKSMTLELKSLLK